MRRAAIVLVALLAAPSWAEEHAMDKIDPALLEFTEVGDLIRVIVTVSAEPSSADPSREAAMQVASPEAAQVLIMNSLPQTQLHLAEPLGESAVLMEVTVDGLKSLAGSPYVVRVQADALDAPQDGTPRLDAPMHGGSAPPGLDAPTGDAPDAADGAHDDLDATQ